MIGILIGAPGAGKSYELVVYHVLPALQQGYKVITNLPLIVEAFGALDAAYPGLIELRTTPQLVRGEFDADPASKGRTDMFHIVGKPEDWKPHTGRVFSNVWDWYSDWRHPVTGNGPKFIVDECHLALPRVGTDKAVSEYFSKHRHFLVNILLATQSAPKVDQDIKDMVQVCYKVRKALALGRSDQYIRRVLDGVRGSVVQEDVRDYKSQFFALYKSHTQSDTAGQEESVNDVTPFIVKWRWATRVVLGLGVLGTLIVVPWAVASWGKKPEPKAVSKPAAAPVAAPQPKPEGLPAWASSAGVVALPAAPAPAQPASAAQVVEKGPPEPFGAKGMHVLGRFTTSKGTAYFVAVSQNAVVVATYASSDLETMGYRFRALTDCAAVVEWSGRMRTITCDIAQQGPSVGGSPSSSTQPSSSGHVGAGARGDPPPAGGALAPGAVTIPHSAPPVAPAPRV